MGKTNLTQFDYSPGDKWSCGYLNLKAKTPLGLFEWNEVVPGPRHSEESRELTVKLNGHEIDMETIPGYLNFEPPGKDGKWADLFAASRDDVQADLEAWFEDSEAALVECLEEANESNEAL